MTLIRENAPRIEGGGDRGYYTRRYIVRNDETGVIGSYGVHFTPERANIAHHAARTPQYKQDPETGSYAYGASRDYHRPATDSDIKRYDDQQRYFAMSDAEQEAYEAEHGYPVARYVSGPCCYLPGAERTICDGSSLVEITLDDERAWQIAEMMAS
jgi:hypothetical protein